MLRGNLHAISQQIRGCTSCWRYTPNHSSHVLIYPDSPENSYSNNDIQPEDHNQMGVLDMLELIFIDMGETRFLVSFFEKMSYRNSRVAILEF